MFRNDDDESSDEEEEEVDGSEDEIRHLMRGARSISRNSSYGIIIPPTTTSTPPNQSTAFENMPPGTTVCTMRLDSSIYYER